MLQGSQGVGDLIFILDLAVVFFVLRFTAAPR
jgi:hypothetical protein